MNTAAFPSALFLPLEILALWLPVEPVIEELVRSIESILSARMLKFVRFFIDMPTRLHEGMGVFIYARLDLTVALCHDWRLGARVLSPLCKANGHFSKAREIIFLSSSKVLR
jgi:hypothetical protein